MFGNYKEDELKCFDGKGGTKGFQLWDLPKGVRYYDGGFGQLVKELDSLYGLNGATSTRECV